MTAADQDSWRKARAARERLAAQVLSHPAVSNVDIGIDPQGESQGLVLRVHLRPTADLSTLEIPTEVDGIPVRIISGDYRLEG